MSISSRVVLADEHPHLGELGQQPVFVALPLQSTLLVSSGSGQKHQTTSSACHPLNPRLLEQGDGQPWRPYLHWTIWSHCPGRGDHGTRAGVGLDARLRGLRAPLLPRCEVEGSKASEAEP